MGDLELRKRQKHKRKHWQKRKPLSHEVRSGTHYLMFGLILIVCVVLILFFLGASSGAQKGYQLKQLQLQKDTLEDDNRDLKLKLLEVKSTQNIREEAEEGMAPIEDPIFIK
jgi:hypothetical protein